MVKARFVTFYKNLPETGNLDGKNTTLAPSVHIGANRRGARGL